MNKIDIQLLYEYNQWANNRILTASSVLTEELFTKDLSSSHCSIHETLTHILSAEWSWLMRWRGISSTGILNSSDFINIEVLKIKWEVVEKEQIDFIKGLTDESLMMVLSYVNAIGQEWKYTLGQMMQHVANHSSYHRGQVTTMLRQLKVAAVPLDFLVFIDMKLK